MAPAACLWRRMQVNEQQADRQKKNILQKVMTFDTRATDLMRTDRVWWCFLFYFDGNINSDYTIIFKPPLPSPPLGLKRLYAGPLGFKTLVQGCILIVSGRIQFPWCSCFCKQVENRSSLCPRTLRVQSFLAPNC